MCEDMSKSAHLQIVPLGSSLPFWSFTKQVARKAIPPDTPTPYQIEELSLFSG